MEAPFPGRSPPVGLRPVAGGADEVTARLATFVAGLRLDAIPTAAIERAKDLVLDHIGLSIYGTQLPWTQMVREHIESEAGREEASIYGSPQRVPVRAAALVNGAAAHAIELDDTHDESLSHPGSVVIPAALAVAEALDRSGADLLTGMIAGYEAQCRVGSAISHDLLSRGFHPPSTCGVYGATAAAARLMNLDAPTLVSALGSATSMISGTLQFTDDPAGTMIKRLHTGIPAERGVLSAQLAARGFLGPRRGIEGRYGFARVFTQCTDLERVTRDLGARFEIERITVKLYACCKLFHSMLEAIGNCHEEHPFRADEVVAIVPFGPRLMIDTHMEYRPASTMAAQYSLPYACAAAIALDPASPDSFAPEVLDRPDLLRLADLVEPVVDPELEAIFPRKMAGGVRIRLRDGTELTSTVHDSRSSPERPIGRDDVIDKFTGLTASLLTPHRRQAIVDAVVSLERAGSVRPLTALLRDYTIPPPAAQH